MQSWHTTNKNHHHHSHCEDSRHKHGCHVFQLENISVTIENEVFKKHKFFSQTVSAQVLHNCNLSLHEGETVFLIGESGSGKTMLINLLCGTLPENAIVDGKVWFEGDEAEDMVSDISFVPQSLKSLDPMLKYDYQGKMLYPHEMSGGMCRIALIADSVSQNSKIVIADEPTEGLDDEKSQEAIESLIKAKGKNGCLLVITHDLNLALKYADRLAIFKDGTIIEETSTARFQKGYVKQDFTKRMWKCMPERVSFQKSEIQSNKQIVIDNLSVKFGNKTVIDTMSDTLDANEITCFFGDTGTGKSTLCKTIAGWIKPTDGKIDAPEKLQYIPQNPFDSFNPKLTIRKSMRDMNVNSDLLDRKPSELSGGELQRFAIIRALAATPDFLIIDEATSMLDVVTQKKILDLVLRKRDQLNFGLIFVTHDVSLCKKLADRVIKF